MSPHHVTSLWPLIVTEMVIIFSYLEQELSTDTEEWRYVCINNGQLHVYIYIVFCPSLSVQQKML